MGRLAWQFSLMTSAVLFVTGCGSGERAPSAETQQKRLQDAEDSMKKGMEAMKGINGGPRR